MDYDETIKNYLQNGYGLSQAKDEIAKVAGNGVAEEAINSYLDFNVGQLLPYVKQLIEQNYSVIQIKNYLLSKNYAKEIIDAVFERYYKEYFGEYVALLVPQNNDKTLLAQNLKERGFDESVVDKYLLPRTSIPKPSKKFVAVSLVFLIIAGISLLFLFFVFPVDNFTETFSRESNINIEARPISRESVEPGERLLFNIMSRGNVAESLDTLFRYEVYDARGVFVHSDRSSRTLYDLGTFQDSIVIPESLVQGRYFLRVTVDYLGKSSSAEFDFSVLLSSSQGDINLTFPEYDDGTISPSLPSYIWDFPTIPEFSETIVDEDEEDGELLIRTDLINIPSYRNQQDLINAISSMHPSLAFYLCGRMPEDGSRELCFSSINLNYELLGETEFCEDVVMYQEQAICLPKIGNETVDVCDLISNEDARRDCNALASEYAGTLELIMELIELESQESFSGRRLVIPWASNIQSIPDYE